MNISKLEGLIVTPELFLLFANSLPEPMLLVSGDGFIVALSRAFEISFGMSGDVWRDKPLTEMVADTPEEVLRYLQLCSRNRQTVLGAITVRGRDDMVCRAEGCLVRPKSEGASALVMLRLVRKQTAAGQFIALNLQIKELGREIQRRKNAELEALENAERLRTTLASIGDGVISTAVNGHITNMNAVAESLTGWTNAEAVGQPLENVFRIVNEFTRRRVENPAMRALSEGVIIGLANHTILIAKDGTELHIDDSAAPIRCKTGEIVGSVLVFRNINERRQMERQLAERLQATKRLSDIVNSSADAIISKSSEGIIHSWNAAAEQLFGYSAAEAIGRHISIVIPAERLGEEDEIIARIRSGDRVEHFETMRMRSDGQSIHVSLSISPVRDEEGRIVGASKIVRDITERKTADEELRRLAAELSEADRRKDEFLATLAHELRNPLAPIRNGLQIMRLSSGNKQEVEEVRAMMERQVEQMVHLIDDLLDVSRISRGKLELRKQQIELSTVLNHAVETSRTLIESHGHELTMIVPPEPIIVDADYTRLAQVFSNLLNNAAKFSERGGRIRLDVERQGSDVVVSVKDSGLGIASDMLPRIFEMFTQVDRTLEKAQGGLGIGLSLVKRLIKMHDGSIEAFSEGPGKGSEFVARLPVDLSAMRRNKLSNDEDQKAIASGQRRILVADDNKDAATTLALMLKFLGNETHTANDGLRAVEVAEALKPDVIFLDIGMPKLNGYEACRRIREYPWGETIVLIALTGWGQDDDKRRSQEAGFNHHLVKPVDPAFLKKLLADLLPTGGS